MLTAMAADANGVIVVDGGFAGRSKEKSAVAGLLARVVLLRDAPLDPDLLPGSGTLWMSLRRGLGGCRM